jgi:hypothetical protein
MNKYDYAFKLAISGFTLLLVFAVVLNFVPEGTAQSFSSSLALNIVLSGITGVCGLSGLYLWVTGFKRFKPSIGNYSFKWFIYLSFNMLAALYLHWQYKKQNN